MAKPKKEPDPNRLVREAAGRYRTEDGRFTVEGGGPGSWYVADAGQADELGMPLLRGPFDTLADARSAVQEARAAPAPDRPEPRRRPAPEDERGAADERMGRGRTKRPTGRAPKSDRPAPEPAKPQTWLERLGPVERRQAETLVSTLAALGLDDAEGLVRRDVEGDEAAVAARLLRRRVAAEAVDPWASSAAWIGAALAGRGPLAAEADRIRAALDAGLDREGLRALARAIAERSAELVLRAVESGGFEAGAGRPPRGWRLVETDAAGEPTGRPLTRD